MSPSRLEAIRAEMDTRIDPSLSSLEVLVLLLQAELIYILAGLNWQPAPKIGGQHRKHPDWVGWLFLPFITKEGSQRKAGRFLRDNWHVVEEAARVRFGNDAPKMEVGSEPFSRHNFHYFREVVLRSDEEAFMDAFREFAITSALGCEIMNDDQGSISHPHLSRTAATDGKVISPISKAAAGDVGTIYEQLPGGKKRVVRTYPRRFDPTARDYHVGGQDGKKIVLGNKTAHLSVRGEDPNVRVMVDLARVHDDEGGEAVVTSAMVLRLRDNPRVGVRLQAATGDKAWRGTHHRLMLQGGVLSVSGVSAARKATANKPRVAKRSTTQGTWHRPGDEGGQPTDILLVDGHPHLKEVDVEGEIHDRFLERVQTKNKKCERDGTYSWYGKYAVPNDLGGGYIWVRHLSDDADDWNNFNREENLRVISPLDRDFPAMHGRRQDTESTNDLIEQTLWKKRAHSYGGERQFWDLFGLAMLMAVTAPEAYRRGQLRKRARAA
ncbi:MAG: hypothetical protein ABIP03_12095 [Aquihabitans sp.]